MTATTLKTEPPPPSTQLRKAVFGGSYTMIRLLGCFLVTAVLFPQVVAAQYDGTWRNASFAYNVPDFVVNINQVTNFHATLRYVCGSYTYTADSSSTSSVSITGNAFSVNLSAPYVSYTFSGNFVSSTVCTGRYYYIASGPGAGGVSFGNWTTTKFGLNPIISVTPASRDFGTILAGSTTDLTFTVQNTGGGTLSGSIGGVTAPFSVVGAGLYSLGSGARQTITIRFAPDAVGDFTHTFSFSGGGGAICVVSGSSAARPTVGPDVKVNRNDGPLSIAQGEPVSVTVQIDPGGYAGIDAEWWVIAATPLGWYYLDSQTHWIPFDGTVEKVFPAFIGPLSVLPPHEILNYAYLPVGSYSIFFAVDLADGVLDMSSAWHDQASFTVTDAVVTQTNRCLVDDHTRPLPGPLPDGWYYNAMGGDRGLLNVMAEDADGCSEYSQESAGSYRATIRRVTEREPWSYAGLWYAIGHPVATKIAYDPKSMASLVILPKYHSKLVGMEVVVKALHTSAALAGQTFSMEVKGHEADREDVRMIHSWSGTDLAGSYPKTFTATWDPAALGSVSLVTWLLDLAVPGDYIEVGRVSLLLETPVIEPSGEAFLTALAMLLDNYDSTSGMVGDRANFPARHIESVAASAKLAKLLAFGVTAGVCDPDRSAVMITDIARVLLDVVPEGPTGQNALWPRFTVDGGTRPVKSGEWSTGDTASALLDICVALKMIGDPSGQLPSALNHLKAIRWDVLRQSDSGFSYGYDTNGVMLSCEYGFGTEFIGVAVAALAGGNVMGVMPQPPTDTGSGYILHASCPLLPYGTDCWGNDWSRLRLADANRQIAWYSSTYHANSCFVQAGAFGLSAAERPEGRQVNDSEYYPYQLYGLGGRLALANDGSSDIVVPHYSAMVADIKHSAAIQMWWMLRSAGLVTPLNNIESVRVNPSSGLVMAINYLKGSRNLSLQAEGWAWTSPAVVSAAYAAVAGIPELASAWRILFGPQSLSVTHYPAKSDLASFNDKR